MSKTVKWILIAVGVLLVSLVALSKMGAFGKDEGAKVTAEKAKKATITEVVSATGKIYPEVEVKISPDISGEITELTVEEGDTVKRGQLLARIYADIYNIQKNQAASGVAQSQAQVATTQAQVASSQAQVNNSKAALDALQAQMDQAQRTFDMQKQLFDDKVISRNEFNVAESNLRSARANYNAAVQGIKGGLATIQSAQAGVQNARAGVQSAQASLARANKDLGRTAIVAPMDGVVSLLSVKKGEKVAGNSFNVGTEMLRIADMNKIEVRVDVGENDIPKVKLGDTAIITVDAYSNRKFKGLVTQIASSNNGAAAQSALGGTNTDVTQYKVHIRVLPESYKEFIVKGSFPFKPGMTASADIQTQTHKEVIAVPINAVTTRDKSDTASVKNFSARKKEIKTDEGSGNLEDDLDVVVFVIQKDGTVKRTVVTTSIQDIKNIEVTSGLKEGEEVVTGPYDVVSKKLRTGEKVKVVDKKDLY